MASKFTNVISTGLPVSVHKGSLRKNPYVTRVSSVVPLTGKEKKARLLQKTSNYGYSSSALGGNTMLSGQQQFFSPQLSTDFLELPQSLREKREIYRHFYNTDEVVAQAIDLHTELPLSKVRLSQPKPNSCPPRFKDPADYGKYILKFYERMCQRTKLFQHLILAVHHYWLDGNCVTGDTSVTTRNGERRADAILLGDELLTHTGQWQLVEAISTKYADAILELDIARLPNPLRVTGEHPIEVLVNDHFEFRRAEAIQSGDFVRVTWPKTINDVQIVDIMEGVPKNVLPTDTGYVICRTQQRPRVPEAQTARSGLLNWLKSLPEPTRRSRQAIADELGVKLHTLHNVILTLDTELPVVYRERVPGGPKHGDHTLWHPLNPEIAEDKWFYDIEREFTFQGVPKTLNVDEDFLYLLGYWLGDGTLSRDNSRGTWGRGHFKLFFGPTSRPQQERIRTILNRMVGKEHVVESIDTKDVVALAINHNPAIIEWWAREFGTTSRGSNPKRIPDWVMSLPVEKQKWVLAGLIDSDGCVSYSEVNSSVVTISMVSEGLISQIRDLMLRTGGSPSYRVVPPHEGAWLDGHLIKSNGPFYALTMNDMDECAQSFEHSMKWRRAKHTDAKWVQTHSSYKRCGKELAFLVNNVEAAPGEVVYNFQVAEDHTFRAGFISTHNCVLFAEDSDVQVPDNVGYEDRLVKESVLKEDGSTVENFKKVRTEKQTREDDEHSHYQKAYKGWGRLIVLPIDQVKISSYNFTQRVRMEMIPSERDRALIEQAKAGDELAQEMAEEIPEEIRDHIGSGKLIPLGTNPDEGSFAYLLSGRKGAGEDLGQSILDRTLRTLYFREKLRQSQTQIASRAMTPKRVIWAEDISAADVDALREQVDMALVDPDYSIIVNYEIHWEEMGSRDRLLDLSSEYEQTERRLRTGLGVTESLLSGETLYSGDRLKLEVINQRYLFLREILQEYVEQYLFRPVAIRKGFVEKDEWGEEDVPLYPKLSFSRLPLRDSQDTYDALFNLYQKGSVDISLILELFNIDPNDTRVKLESDLFTVNDATFNEVIRGIYGEVGRTLAEKTDIADRIGKYLNLKIKDETAAEDPGRF